MGTLSSELGPHIDRSTERPRIYVDANVPAGLVLFMRTKLDWDVLFVMEHAELRRARDQEHFRLAREMHRTLLTLDHDYCDDRQFPPGESGGVIVISAPDERGLAHLLVRIDRIIFRSRVGRRRTAAGKPPLLGRKLEAPVDWPPPRPRRGK